LIECKVISSISSSVVKMIENRTYWTPSALSFESLTSAYSTKIA
jgi:hypothetical protein